MARQPGNLRSVGIDYVAANRMRAEEREAARQAKLEQQGIVNQRTVERDAYSRADKAIVFNARLVEEAAKQARWEAEQENEAARFRHTAEVDQFKYENEAPLRRANLTKAEVEAENAKSEQGLRRLGAVSPITRAKILGKVFANFELTPADAEQYRTDDNFRKRLDYSILDAAATGTIIDDETALGLGLTRKAIPTTGMFWNRKAAPAPGQVEEGMNVVLPRITLPGESAPAAQSGLERGLANLNQPAAPQPDTPEVAQAKWLLNEYKRRVTKDPNFAYTLSNGVLDKLEAAHALVSGQGAPAAQPAEPVGVSQPRGRMVSDADLAAMAPDLNGDGKISREEVDAEYQTALQTIQKADAVRQRNPDAFAKLNPATLQAVELAKKTKQAYESIYKKNAQARVEQGLNARR